METLICRETVYAELRSAAGHFLRGRNHRGGLQPTVLVHEAYLRLTGGVAAASMPRAAFVIAAVGEMKRVLVDAVRGDDAKKRGGGRGRVPLDSSVLALPSPTVDYFDLHDALLRLAALSPRQARVVELRYLGGLDEDEVADVLAVSRRTVQLDWRGARAWLRRELSRGEAATSDTSFDGEDGSASNERVETEP